MRSYLFRPTARYSSNCSSSCRRSAVYDNLLVPGLGKICIKNKFTISSLSDSKIRPKNTVLRFATITSQAAVASKKRDSSKNKKDRDDIVPTEKDKHLFFDRVVITVKAGNGGNGEIMRKAKSQVVRNHKYKAGRSMPKNITLPPRPPLNGQAGADVILTADESLDTLLHLHKKKKYSGRNGSNANVGETVPLRKRSADGSVNVQLSAEPTMPLQLRVPPGTVVRRKRGGTLLADITKSGQRVLVARGGRGGLGVDKTRRSGGRRKKSEDEEEMIELLDDMPSKDYTQGENGEEICLELLLRVVADVGLVGFPNVGKSSLLALLTRAQPEIANYPFTTLMPNLGVVASGPQDMDTPSSAGAVMADLPGLIQGAHKGRGLGREFLRHLRRTRMILHVVDVVEADPVADYLAVRDELRMYNPEFVQRPHVVALNKIDVLGESSNDWIEEIRSNIWKVYEENGEAENESDSDANSLKMVPPVAIIACSAVLGTGHKELLDAISSSLKSDAEVIDQSAGW